MSIGASSRYVAAVERAAALALPLVRDLDDA
jgi:hypothetical protein